MNLLFKLPGKPLNLTWKNTYTHLYVYIINSSCVSPLSITWKSIKIHPNSISQNGFACSIFKSGFTYFTLFHIYSFIHLTYRVCLLPITSKRFWIHPNSISQNGFTSGFSRASHLVHIQPTLRLPCSSSQFLSALPGVAGEGGCRCCTSGVSPCSVVVVKVPVVEVVVVVLVVVLLLPVTELFLHALRFYPSL